MFARSLAFALLLLTGAAVPAGADRSETIRLTYAAPSDAVKLITGQTGPANPGGGGLGRGASGHKNLMPEGITAWAVNPARKELNVTGTDEAIESLKKIIRLLDIPTREISFTIRMHRLDAAELKEAARDPLPIAGADGAPLMQVALLEPDRVREWEKKAALASADLVGGNNVATTFRWRESPERPWRLAEITPRVNGDGTITLVVPVTRELRGVEAGQDRAETVALRRVASGQTLAVTLLDSQVTLVITPKLVPTR